jgi:aminopeptidase N
MVVVIGILNYIVKMQQAQLENKTLADDIVDIMGTWVYQMGYPTVHVEYTEEGKIKLTQSRYLEDPTAADKGIFQSEYGLVNLQKYVTLWSSEKREVLSTR